jgi:hypothetical protein
MLLLATQIKVKMRISLTSTHRDKYKSLFYPPHPSLPYSALEGWPVGCITGPCLPVDWRRLQGGKGALSLPHLPAGWLPLSPPPYSNVTGLW